MTVVVVVDVAVVDVAVVVAVVRVFRKDFL